MRNPTKKIITLAVMLFSTIPAHAYELGMFEIHGFASLGYLDSSENNLFENSEDGSFEFNEFGLNVTTTFFDEIDVGAQIMSRDYGAVGNNDIIINWALIDYGWQDELGFKIGKIKRSHGLYNDVRDYDFLRTSILLPQSIYDDNKRELIESYTGGALYGVFNLGNGGNLGYDLYYGIEQSIHGDSGHVRSFNLEYIDSWLEYSLGGRIKWHTPVSGLLLAVSYLQSDFIFDGVSPTAPVYIRTELPLIHNTIFSVEYSKGSFTIAAEYEMKSSDFNVEIDMSRLGMPDDREEYDWTQENYYGLLSYRFTEWFTAGVYYSYEFPDLQYRNGDTMEYQRSGGAARQNDLALTARFDLTDFWLIKLEYHSVDGTSLIVEADNPEGFETKWDFFALKTTFSF